MGFSCFLVGFLRLGDFCGGDFLGVDLLFALAMIKYTGHNAPKSSYLSVCGVNYLRFGVVLHVSAYLNP